MAQDVMRHLLRDARRFRERVDSRAKIADMCRRATTPGADASALVVAGQEPAGLWALLLQRQ